MKYLIPLFFTVLTACHCEQKATSNVANNLVPTDKDTLPKAIALPKGIEKLIAKFKAEEVTNPPREVWQYTLIDKTVFYVPAVCCDNFSDLYNEAGELIAHPDGGFTGKGDNKMPNFEIDRTDGKLVWKDKRKEVVKKDTLKVTHNKKLF
jgi:ribosomal protein L17